MLYILSKYVAQFSLLKTLFDAFICYTVLCSGIVCSVESCWVVSVFMTGSTSAKLGPTCKLHHQHNSQSFSILITSLVNLRQEWNRVFGQCASLLE